ncbi:MAG: hypothetical protein HUK40_14565 [Desulfobacter sp.]|nr:hypothetical protein [Desulfobacter sp.]MDD9303486.1 hypothetical protein [Desulfobacter sp.]WDP87891.1 MAG: hypothetical protein HUN05_02500 [Desulfobacter sp.]
MTLILILVQAVAGYAGDPLDLKESAPPPPVAVSSEETLKESTSLEMLHSIVRLKQSLRERMVEKKKLIRQADSETEKGYLSAELKKLDQQLAGAAMDFERIATGVEIGLFAQKKTEQFNWKNELLSLAEPGIMELKRLTVKARHKTKLKDELSAYQDLVPVALKARTRIEALIERAQDPVLEKNLKELLPEYKGVETQIKSKLDLVRLQLAEIEREETSLIDSTQDSVKRFFKTRGLFLFIAVAACIGVVLFLRFLFLSLIRLVPGYRSKYRPFHIRMLELIYRVMSMGMALLAVIMVFYLFEDWVLLSLAIIFLMGVGWATKQTLPKFVNQSRLMLNIGAVREGERMIYQGVPWMVKQINLYTLLVNPALGIQLRVPIEVLMDKTSRAFHPSEPWFPCRKNDWVILADGTRGGVISLSHETVELVQRGGARKTYQTGDFLSLSPLNLSVNFRLKIPFGISYGLQAEATVQVPELLAAHIQKQIEAEGYEKDLLNLRVEFAEAGASSLDLVVIADFKGDMAPLYNRLSRAIQRWCVDAATQHGWDIPFPQMMIHQAI